MLLWEKITSGQIIYVTFTETTKEEGFERIAKLFEMVEEIEKTHEEKYRKLLKNIKNGEVFSSKEKTP